MVLDKLLTLAVCALSYGGNNLDIREPQRINYDDSTYKIQNGLDNDIIVYSSYTDEDVEVPAKSTAYIIHDTDYHLGITIPNFDWDNEDTIWYAFFDGPNVPNYPNWEYQGENSYFQPVQASANNYGFGIYKERNLPRNQDLYIDTSLLGGVSHGVKDWAGIETLLPPNASIRIYKEDNTYAQLTNLKFRRVNIENSSNYDCLIYSELGTNNYLNIANNKGYTKEYFSGFATPSDIFAIQPYLTYYNGYTNKIRFVSGNYEKVADSPNGLGYIPLSNYGLSEYPTGYIAYNTGGVDETVVTITGGMGLVASSLLIVSSFFGYKIFPGITLGLLLCIPLMMELIFVIIKLIKKGS